MRKILILLFCVTSLSVGQTFAQEDNETGVIYCESFMVSRPLKDLLKENPVNEKKIARSNMRKENGESNDREHREPQKFPLLDSKHARNLNVVSSILISISSEVEVSDGRESSRIVEAVTPKP